MFPFWVFPCFLALCCGAGCWVWVLCFIVGVFPGCVCVIGFYMSDWFIGIF